MIIKSRLNYGGGGIKGLLAGLAHPTLVWCPIGGKGGEDAVAVERATEQMVSSSSTVNFDDASSRQKLCVSEVVQSCSAERKLAHTAHPTTTTRLHPSPFAHRAIPRCSSPAAAPYPASLSFIQRHCVVQLLNLIFLIQHFLNHTRIYSTSFVFFFLFYDQTKARRFSGATDLLLSNYWGEKGARSCCFFFRLLTCPPPL